MISTGAAAEASRLLDQTAAVVIPDRALEARRLLNLGWLRSLQTSHEDGLALLEKARVLAEESGVGEVVAQVEIRRGTVLTYLKRQEEAERSFQRSLSLARGLQDPYLEGSALGNLGFLRLNNGRYEEAIYYFEQVPPLARKIQAPALEALTEGNLGWCYFRLGDLDKAAQRFEQSQTMLAALGKLLEHQVHLGNLGSVWLIRGDYRKAIGYYERALAAARRLNNQRFAGDWLSNLATAHIELGEIETAAQLIAEARRARAATSGKLPDAWLEVNEGRILEARGDIGGAAKRYLAVAESQAAEPTARFDAKSRLARLMARQQRLAEAGRHYRELMAELRRRRGALSKLDWKITWQASLIGFYKDYVDFLWRNGQREEALEAAEASRAQVLAEHLGETAASGVSARQLSALARAQGCTILSYWLAGQGSYLWVIRGRGIESHRLRPQREIAAAVDSYRRSIEGLRDPLAAGSPAAEQLSSMLLGALRNQEGCFVISPDQELHGLNFETLLVPDGKGGRRYWAEAAELSVVPSLAIRPATRTPTGREALLLGDPAPVDPVEFPRLANAGAELEAVARLLAPAPATVLQGARATPASYQQAEPARFGLIHIAAHATANRESPLDSAIILSREGARHSLPAREIARIPIRANLVTVSACRGAGARTYAGEGTVGLAWAFLHAGARNVIAGLWAVDDLSTSRLMQDVYAALAKGAAPAAALRSAKLAMIRSHSAARKPYYWAPFQLYRLP